MRISDWSSDVCSSDLLVREPALRTALLRLLLALLEPNQQAAARQLLLGMCQPQDIPEEFPPRRLFGPKSPLSVRKVDGELTSPHQIGRASGRERVCQDV